MEIQVAAICDSAVDYSGKLSLLGAFDTIIAQTLPAVHPQCSVALRLIFRKEEEGPHTIVVNFIDEDGKSIIPPLETTILVQLPEDFYFATNNLVLNLQQLTFQNEGLYSVDVAMDNAQIVSIPMQVMLAPMSESGGHSDPLL
jgi:hypothetical protein